MSTLRHPVIVALIGAILFGVSLTLRTETGPSPVTEVDSVIEAPVVSLRDRSIARTLLDAFKALPLEAQAVAVWDAKEERLLFGKEQSSQLPLASLTKMMLAYTADQVMSPSTIVTVTGKDLAEEGSSGIMAGERFLYGDLRSATLVASLNDGANAISRTMGEILKKNESPAQQKKAAIALMNASSEALGLEQTYFYNEDGLDLGVGQPGALGSAQDVAKIFSALVHQYPETLRPTTGEGYILRSRMGTDYQYWNTNQHIEDVPGIIGSKTGYTALADGNLAVAFMKDDHPLIVVILGSSKEGRFTDVKRVVDFLREHPIPKFAEVHDMIETPSNI